MSTTTKTNSTAKSAAVSKPKRALASTATAFPEPLQLEARQFFLANREANAFGRQAKLARGALYSGMKEAKLSSGVFTTEIDGVPQTLACTISTPTTNAVDVVALAKLVPLDVLLKIVSATQDAVKEHVGEAILRLCLVSGAGTENVTVKIAAKA